MNNVNTFISAQVTLNGQLAGHVHTELGAQGMPTLPSLTVMKTGAETTYKQLTNNIVGGSLAIGINLKELKKYINPGSPDDKYINSRRVTTS